MSLTSNVADPKVQSAELVWETVCGLKDRAVLVSIEKDSSEV